MRTAASRIPILIIAVLFFLGGIVVALALQDTDETEEAALAYAPGAYVHGSRLDEWNARYWQWTLSFPASSYPGYDASGASCTSGQSGPVFFIPGNMPPCTIPAGVSVLIPVIGVECSTSDPFPYTGGNEEELRACAAREAARYTNISVTMEGRSISRIEHYRAPTSPFSVMLPARNVLAAPEGPAWVAADGYIVILKPLPPGEHTIIIHSELTDGTVLPDERLVLTVVQPSWSPEPATPAGITSDATPVN